MYKTQGYVSNTVPNKQNYFVHAFEFDIKIHVFHNKKQISLYLFARHRKIWFIKFKIVNFES